MKKWMYGIILIVCICVGGFCAYQAWQIYNEDNEVELQTDKIKKDYYEIADIIINNIKLNLQKSYDIYHQLDCIPEARRYCPNGVFYDKV